MTNYYAIGASSTVTLLSALTVPVYEPTGRYLEAAQWLNLANGGQRGQGFPVAVWEFTSINQLMVNQLRTFCAGQSAAVWIVTRRNDGTFAKFSAVMLWPGPDQMRQRTGANKASPLGFYERLNFTFRRLVFDSVYPP